MADWVPVPGVECIEVTAEGGVRTVTRQVTSAPSGYRPAFTRTLAGKELTPWIHQGYRYVTVPGGRRFKVSRLVCMAFHGAPEAGWVARHLNDDKADDRAENLAWGTQAQNARDAIVNGKMKVGETRHTAKLTQFEVDQIRLRRAAGEKTSALAGEFGVSAGTVGDICSGRTWAWLD